MRGPNIALNKNASQSPGWAPAYRAVDGNTAPDFNNGSCTHTNEHETYNAWWAVNLGGYYQISGIMIYRRKLTTVRERLSGFKVIGKPDNITLFDEAEVNPRRYNDSVIDIQLDDPQLFTSITISLPTLSPLTLCEVEIFAACRSPPDISNGRYSPVQPGYGNGSVITVTCDQGHTLYGNSHRTCQENGSWSTEPRCIDTICNYPGKFDNGLYTTLNVPYSSDNRLLGDDISVVCDLGHGQTSGSIQMTCALNMSSLSVAWNDTTPTCSWITCPWPEEFSDRYYYTDTQIAVKNRVPYGTVIHASCDTSLYEFTGDENRKCGKDSSWSGVAPTCAMVCQSQIQAGPMIGASIGGFASAIVVMVIAMLLRRKYACVGCVCCKVKERKGDNMATARTDENGRIDDVTDIDKYETTNALESITRDAEVSYESTVPDDSKEHVYSDLDNSGPENETEKLDSKKDYVNLHKF